MATLFPYDPDWDKTVVETLEYLTTVITASCDSEQRQAMRSVPRVSYEFETVPMTTREASVLEGLVHGNPAGQWDVPCWPEQMLVTSTAGVSTSTLHVQTTVGRDVVVGQTAMLWRDPLTTEVVTIAGVGATAVTLASPVTAAWTPGARLVPLRTGILDATFELQRPSRDTAICRVKFLCDPRSETVDLTVTDIDLSASAPRPDWVEGSWTRRESFAAQRLDNKVSRVQLDATGVAPRGSREVRWVCEPRSEAESVRTFFRTQVGRRNHFWYPTWSHDVEAAATATAGSLTLTVKKIGFAATYAAGTEFSRTRLAAFRPNGTHHKIYVDSAIDNGDGTETLTLVGPLEETVTPDTMLSFRTLCRFADDALSIQWLSMELAVIETELVEVPLEAARATVTPTDLVLDTFTGSSGALAGHAAEVGGTWSDPSAAFVLDGSGVARQSITDGLVYRAYLSDDVRLDLQPTRELWWEASVPSSPTSNWGVVFLRSKTTQEEFWVRISFSVGSGTWSQSSVLCNSRASDGSDQTNYSKLFGSIAVGLPANTVYRFGITIGVASVTVWRAPSGGGTRVTMATWTGNTNTLPNRLDADHVRVGLVAEMEAGGDANWLVLQATDYIGGSVGGDE